MEAFDGIKEFVEWADLKPWPLVIVLVWSSFVKRLAAALKLDKWVEASAAYVTEDFDDLLKDFAWGVLTCVWAVFAGWLFTEPVGVKAHLIAGLTYGLGAIGLYVFLDSRGWAEKLWLKPPKA